MTNQSTTTGTLDERTLRFASDVRKFVSRLPRAMMSSEDARQLVRASGSVGANYIEASESIGREDFMMRLRICLKESKECTFWLRLLAVPKNLEQERVALAEEARQLLLTFCSLLSKVRKDKRR